MSKVSEFQRIRNARVVASEWAGMVGRDYRGGGGGTGAVRSVAIRECVVYFQEYDGATNYHDMPDAIRKYVDAATFAIMPAIIADAMVLMNAEEEWAAKEAHEEHRALMLAAGLPVPA